MKHLMRTFSLLLMLFFAATSAQAVTLDGLFDGGSITAGDKLFDNWSLDFYGSGDSRQFDATNIVVTSLNDGGLDPGPGLRFSILNDELSVTGNDILNYVDLRFRFRASVLDPGLQIKDYSLMITDFSMGTVNNVGYDDLGMVINEWVGTSSGLDDLGLVNVEVSTIGGVSSNLYNASADFMPMSEIWVTKDISVWSTYSTDTADLAGFNQRFSQTVIPEPSTFILLGGGLAGLAFVVRRRKKE